MTSLKRITAKRFEARRNAPKGAVEGAQPTWGLDKKLPLPSEFAMDDRGLGLGDEPFPEVLRTLDEFVTKPYQEAVLRWGIGAGKGFTASLFAAYRAAWVMWQMLRGEFYPQFDLAEGSEVVIATFGPEPMVFGDCYRMVANSPWFARHCPVDPTVSNELRFLRDKNKPSTRQNRWPLRVRHFMPGTKKSLGMNALDAAIDEVNFWLLTDDRDAAEEKYLEVKRRIVSRFLGAGKMLFISSACYHADFGSRKIQEAKEHPDRVLASIKATWEVKPIGRFEESGGETFDWIEEGEGGRALYNIPIQFKTEFEGNALLAARDYGSLTMAAETPWDAGAERYMGIGQYDGFEEPPPLEGRGPDYAIEDAWDGPWLLADWFVPDGDVWLPSATDPVFLHFDLAISERPGSDALGLAMAHAVQLDDPDDPVEVILDLAANVTAADVGGERYIGDARALVRELDRRGFRIGMVTFDGFQSADSIQQLRRQGYRADVFSVDRDLEAYDELKQALNLKRLRYGPGWWCSEYAHLEFKDGKRIDHQSDGAVTSKDEADAVAAVVRHARVWGRRSWTNEATERQASRLEGFSEDDRERIRRHQERMAGKQERWAKRRAEREKRKGRGE